MKIRTLLLSIGVVLFISTSVSGQCLYISCPGDSTIQAGVNCDAVFNFNAPMGLDTCTPNLYYSFLTCGGSGIDGPTQSQANTAYNSTNLNGLVSVTNGVQYWIVPITATYTIKAVGAAGGGSSRGLGAGMRGDFALVAGDTLLVVVGQEGYDPNDNSATGGGGSYVVLVDNTSSTVMTSTGLKVTPLIIAGGGGANPGTLNSACNANITTSGNAGSGVTASGIGGINGNGGAIAESSGNNRAGGGGGFLTDGERTGTCGNSGTESGFSFLNGSKGGVNTSCGTGYEGGFGGGGGANSSGWRGSGGGGGYSGGGGGQTNSNATTHRAGGGGSFNSGSNKVDSTGVGTSDGFVNIIIPGTPTITTQIAGLASGSLFPLGITKQTFVVTDGTNFDSCSFYVTVIDTPATSIAPFPFDTTCTSSDSIILPLAVPTGGSYSGPGVSGSYFNPAISGAGLHWIVYTDVNCPMSDSTSIMVENLPSTILGSFNPDTVCDISDPISLPLGSPSGGTYSGIGVSGSNFDPSITGPGMYWVYYTVSECQSSDSTSIVVMNCVGIGEIQKLNEFVVVPNPGNGLFKLEGNGSQVDEVMVHNALGKLIFNSSDWKLSSTIDLTSQPDGLYILTVRSEQNIQTHQLIKQ